MKKYDVTLYFHTSATVTVKARNEEDAIERAYLEVKDEDLLANLQEDGDPSVEDVEDWL